MLLLILLVNLPSILPSRIVLAQGSGQCQTILSFWDRTKEGVATRFTFFTCDGLLLEKDFASVIGTFQSSQPLPSYHTYVAEGPDGNHYFFIDEKGLSQPIDVPSGYFVCAGINKTYVPIFPEKYLGRESYEGLNAVRILNTETNKVIPGSWDFVYGFSEGLFSVQRHGKQGFVDENGVFVIAPIYHRVRCFNCGVAKVFEHEKSIADAPSFYARKMLLIDRFGRTLVEFEPTENADALRLPSGEPFSAISWPFVDNRTIVYLTKRPSGSSYLQGIINRKGELVSSLRFLHSHEHFSEGLLGVVDQETKRWGFIDTDGNMVIPPVYDYVYPFHNEMAAVRGVGETFWTWIDKSGKMLFKSKAPKATRWYQSQIGYSQDTFQCYTPKGKSLGSPFTNPDKAKGDYLPIRRYEMAVPGIMFDFD